MWMNHTIVKGLAENVQEAVRILDKPEVSEAFRNAPGFRAVYLVEDLDEPGSVISISVWDNAEQGQAFYSSDTYKMVFGSTAKLLVAPPERKFFRVWIENLP